jgi:hypothetical protein
VIKELREGFALPTLCLEKFWATEAALSLASLTYNLTVLFQRHLGWQKKVTIRSLRFWLFVASYDRFIHTSFFQENVKESFEKLRT